MIKVVSKQLDVSGVFKCASIFIVFFMATSVFASKNSTGAKAYSKYVPGEVLVKFKEGVSDLKKASLRSINTGQSSGTLKKASLRNKFSKLAIEHWSLPEGKDVQSALIDLQKNESVLYAQPNYYLHKMAVPYDTYYYNQWALDAIDWLSVWESDPAPSAASVTVAVVDDGVYSAHPDLNDNLVEGFNVLSNNSNTSPDFANSPGSTHGTAVAGVIGAETDNGIGVSGAAWDVNIMPILFASDTQGDTTQAISAFRKARKLGADIINFSYGLFYYDNAMADAISDLEDAGIIFITSAGNDEVNNRYVPIYPANFPNMNVISVTASRESGAMATWPQYGPFSIDLMAPGEDVYTTYVNVNGGSVSASYLSVDGTSFSAPYVAGIAAMIKGEYPDADIYEIKGRLLAGATFEETAKDKVAAGGEANMADSLSVGAKPVLVIKSANVDDNGNGIIDSGETVDLVITLENVWEDATGVNATLSSEEVSIDIPTQSFGDIAKGGTATATYEISMGEFTGHRHIPFRLNISSDAGENLISRYFSMEAGQLLNNVQVDANFASSGYDDAHYYHFSVPVGAESITISTTSSSDIDLFIMRGERPKVYPSYYSLLGDGYDYAYEYLSEDDLSALGLEKAVTSSGNESITINNPVSGNYFALVFDYNGEGDFSYSITAQGVTEDGSSSQDDSGGNSGGGGGGTMPLLSFLALFGIVVLYRRK